MEADQLIQYPKVIKINLDIFCMRTSDWSPFANGKFGGGQYKPVVLVAQSC